MKEILAVDSSGLLIVVGLVVLLFGGAQLPKLARSLGQARKEFEKGQHSDTSEKPGSDAGGSPSA